LIGVAQVHRPLGVALSALRRSGRDRRVCSRVGSVRRLLTVDDDRGATPLAADLDLTADDLVVSDRILRSARLTRYLHRSSRSRGVEANHRVPRPTAALRLAMETGDAATLAKTLDVGGGSPVAERPVWSIHGRSSRQCSPAIN